MNNSTAIVGNINIPLSITDRISSKKIGQLNNTNKLDLFDIYKTCDQKKVFNKHHFK